MTRPPSSVSSSWPHGLAGGSLARVFLNAAGIAPPHHWAKNRLTVGAASHILERHCDGSERIERPRASASTPLRDPCRHMVEQRPGAFALRECFSVWLVEWLVAGNVWPERDGRPTRHRARTGGIPVATPNGTQDRTTRVRSGPAWGASQKHRPWITPRRADRPVSEGPGKTQGRVVKTNPVSSESLPLRYAGAGVLMVCGHDLGAPPAGLGRVAYCVSREQPRKPDGSLRTPSKHQPGRGRKARLSPLGEVWTND